MTAIGFQGSRITCRIGHKKVRSVSVRDKRQSGYRLVMTRSFFEGFRLLIASRRFGAFSGGWRVGLNGWRRCFDRNSRFDLNLRLCWVGRIDSVELRATKFENQNNSRQSCCRQSQAEGFAPPGEAGRMPRAGSIELQLKILFDQRIDSMERLHLFTAV